MKKEQLRESETTNDNSILYEQITEIEKIFLECGLELEWLQKELERRQQNRGIKNKIKQVQTINGLMRELLIEAINKGISKDWKDRARKVLSK